MLNRSPNDYSINGITQNIAELDRIPGIISQLEADIVDAEKKLAAEKSIERDFSDNKIPFVQRKINAMISRIQMLELPATIEAIKTNVAKDAEVIAAAEMIRDQNERDVSPHTFEISKIRKALELQKQLSDCQQRLSENQNAFNQNGIDLYRLNATLIETKQLREAASEIARNSRTIYDSQNADAQQQFLAIRQAEQPEFAAIDQMRQSLSRLEATTHHWLTQKNQSQASMHNAENDERHHKDKAAHATRDMHNYKLRADNAHARKQKVIIAIEEERRALDAAKQTAANSNNGGGYGSSGSSAPPSSTSNSAISVGFGVVIPASVISPPGDYNSSQGGYNSNGGYSSSTSNPGKVIADIENKIRGLENELRTAEDEARQYERQSASENDKARSHEAKADDAHQRAVRHADDAVRCGREAARLEPGLTSLKNEIASKTSSLQHKQSIWRQQESVLENCVSNALHKFNVDITKVEKLDEKIEKILSDTNRTEEANKRLNAKISELNSIRESTESVINQHEYASKHSGQVLNERLKLKTDLAKPYQNKIYDANRIITTTTESKVKKENEIKQLQSQLAAHTDTVEKSRNEFAPVCESTDIADLRVQLQSAESDKQKLLQEYQKQQQVVRSLQGELSSLNSTLRDKTARQKALQGSKLLMDLYQNPQKLLDDLHRNLDTAVKEFSDTHHQGLLWQSRGSLLTLCDRASFIHDNEDVAGKTDNDKLRNKFYQLSGLLWNEISLLIGENDYIKALSFLIKEPRVVSEDLLEEYKILAKQYPAKLNIMTEEEVLNHDAVEYHQAKKAFDDMLTAGPQDNNRDWRQFYAAGKCMSDSIHEQATRKRKASESEFDKRLHTRIFVVAQEVLTHPENEVKLRELHALTAPNTIGKPSIARKVVGAILAFLGGAAAIVGGLALAGILPVISLPIAIPLIAGGGVSLVAGACTLFSGRHRGLSKSYANYEELADKIGKNHHPAAVQVDAKLHPEYFEAPAPSAPTL